MIELVKGVSLGLGLVAAVAAVVTVRRSRIVGDAARAVVCGVQTARVSFQQTREMRRLAEGNAFAEAIADSLAGGEFVSVAVPIPFHAGL